MCGHMCSPSGSRRSLPSFRDKNLIGTAVESGSTLSTPTNQFLRQLEATDPSPAHEFPCSFPTPVRSNSELSSPAVSSPALVQIHTQTKMPS